MGLVEEIGAEQQHVDRAHARLDALRDAASELGGDLLDQGRGGLLSDRVERDARMEHGLRRRAALSIGDLALCFGRLDYDDGERFHVGRLGVLDADGEPLVIDWRTPAAEPFYRATTGDRRGVARRRHIRMKQRTVVGIDDEVLTTGGDGATASGLCGEGALLATVSAARTGRMGDIVATIQAEQDRAIRAPLRGVLVVQGGPGTGKTAVALHRAAYLLYAHHFPLANQGVLVVGPNAVFCRYVEDVLPGLGETGVLVTTIAGLHRSYTAAAQDPPATAAIKARLSMVETLAAAIADHEHALDSDCFIGHGRHRLRVTVAQSAAIVTKGQTAGGHRAGRRVVETEVLRHLGREAKRAARRSAATGVAQEGAGTDPSQDLEMLRRSPEVRALVDTLWPKLTPEQIVGEALAAEGAPFDGDELSEHDIALLDEAEHLLGPAPATKRRPRRRHADPDTTMDATLAAMGLLPDCPECGSELGLAGSRFRCEQCDTIFDAVKLVGEAAYRHIRDVVNRMDRTYSSASVVAEEQRTFGHIVVDEAQDITPMQWRMLARRGPTGSMTIVGDLGQAKHPWSLTDWDQACGLAAPGCPRRVLELTVNYRTPAEVMTVVSAFLADRGEGLRVPTSVRSTGEHPSVAGVRSETDSTRLAADLARREAALVAPGKVAVIHPVGSTAPPSLSALDGAVIDLDPVSVKGLEFDSVVVVDPDRQSVAELYVALTRTTRRLVLVTPNPLPSAVAALVVPDGRPGEALE